MPVPSFPFIEYCPPSFSKDYNFLANRNTKSLRYCIHVHIFQLHCNSYTYLPTPIAIILTSHPCSFSDNSYHVFNRVKIPRPHKLHCDTTYFWLSNSPLNPLLSRSSKVQPIFNHSFKYVQQWFIQYFPKVYTLHCFDCVLVCLFYTVLHCFYIQCLNNIRINVIPAVLYRL